MDTTDWTYGVALRPEAGDIQAYASALPEAIASGATEADALREIREALSAAVRGRIKFGEDLAAPSSGLVDDEAHRVSLPADLAAKASIYVAWRASGLSKTALAARLGIGEKEMRRILDPDHGTRLDALAATAEALGYDLLVGSRRAA